jgi:predicted lipoprotein with Yx(FWY)xxD motif
MKKAWIWILIIIVIIVLGYLGRHQIKALFAGYSAPSSQSSYTAPITTSGSASGNIISTMSGTNGSYLVSANGMTLYVFDNDKNGVIGCTGSCLSIWPPYLASVAPATLPANVTLITRPDGTMQYAYKGRLIYNYSGDQAPGDMNGDGINGTWHIAKP